MVNLSLVEVYLWVYETHALWIWALFQEMSFGMFSGSRLTCGPRCWTPSLIAPHGLPVCRTPGFQQSTPTVSQKPVCTCLIMKNRFVFWQPAEFPKLFKSMNYIIDLRTLFLALLLLEWRKWNIPPHSLLCSEISCFASDLPWPI